MTRALLFFSLPILAVILHDLARRPTIRRLALRNLVRRRNEALLVVAGSLLGTAIITASFIVGDTQRASIRDFGRTQYGPIDETVTLRDPAALPTVLDLLQPLPANTDGVLPVVQASAAVATVGAARKAEPDVVLLEADFNAARAFGGRPGDTGLAKAGPTPAGDEVLMSHHLASRLNVRAGASVQIYAYGQVRSMRVRAVNPSLGLAGYGRDNLFVAPGVIASLAGRGISASAPPRTTVFVSNRGGPFDGVKYSNPVRDELNRRLTGKVDASVERTKRNLLDDADSSGKSLTTLFAGIGSFSVIAGILLLVNIFVMLAEERKSELGMLRAVGLKRNQLVRAFGLEGGIYAIVAAITGAVIGVGIGRVIVVVAQSVFNRSRDSGFGLTLRFTVLPHTVIGGAVIGGAIALLTAWISSARIGRLNVIRAIRDQPEPVLQRQRLRTTILGSMGVALGLVMFSGGISGKSWFPTIVGLPVAAYCAIPLLTRALPRKVIVSAACIVGLVWPVLCFTLLPDIFENTDIPTFVVQGVLLVGAGVMLVSTNAEKLARVTDILSGSGRTLAARLAFAYPLARRFRTSMLLGIYALILFVLTFLAVFSSLFGNQAPQLSNNLRAGYDVVVDSNFANPISQSTLTAQRDVTAVAPLLRAFPEFQGKKTERRAFFATGFDRSILARGVPKLNKRVAGDASDRATWERVLGSTDQAIIPSEFLENRNGPPSNTWHVGDRFTMYNPLTLRQQAFTVAGVVDMDFPQNGVLVPAPVLTSVMGNDAVPSRFYAAVRPGADAAAVASRLKGDLVAQGVRADSFKTLVTDRLQQQQGFFHLMEGYLALGLLVGVAGLGVVMVRAVRERRRQIGMLRAMGFPHRVVRSAFLLEATFIAVQGMVIGTVLALIVSYTLLSNSKTFGEDRLPFSVPWLLLSSLIVGAGLASLAAALGPAAQASRIKPAVALRIDD